MRDLRKTLIIAEAGVNHNGSPDLARRLVDAAKKAGADAVKFQTFQAEKLASRTAGKAAYQKKQTPPRESQLEMLRALELDAEAHRKLLSHCRKAGITFLSSPFDEESANLLECLGVSLLKIPSGEITNLPFLRHVAGKKIPLILSTGMATLGEVEEALETISSIAPIGVTLLHCVTEYPAPYEQVNLLAMETLRKAFRVPVGYSDHTPGIEVPIAAVALGAEVIEKHFTLDKNLPGPDHKASLDPEEFMQMVSAIRRVESALGDGIKRPAECERKNMTIARKSLVALRDIRPGERLTGDMVTIKRPGDGISPRDLEKILGLQVVIAVGADEVLTWDKLK
jgi:N-acetylneuraminate synthase/N,N'-diacetyllegionaminate synthase